MTSYELCSEYSDVEPMAVTYCRGIATLPAMRNKFVRSPYTSSTKNVYIVYGKNGVNICTKVLVLELVERSWTNECE